MNDKTSNNKVIVIVGATASKKTTLAKQLFNHFDCEIINADAFQIYKHLDIGTNKLSKEEIKKYHVHLIDELALNEPIDICIYQALCNKKIQEIFNKHKIPIICGGSNLYIDAVIKGYCLKKIPAREHINYFNDWDYDDIYDYVLKNDYDTAIKINKNNQKRIIRAAQLIHELNNTKSSVEKETDRYVYDCFIIETRLDRNELYNLINQRVDLMKENGFVNEVKEILKNYPNFLELQAAKAIGYYDIAYSILHHQDIDWDLIKQKTRNYAKKQLTWNRNKYQQLRVFDLTKDDLSVLINEIKQFLTK